ncbi:MAG: hypothetical protein D6704_07635 [Nitrospirae bacterium]|nr:MAG: hypothetical protein D6704_07635 [Nitrospirota bacterium]
MLVGRYSLMLCMLVTMLLGFSLSASALTDVPGKVSSIYSPVIRVVPDQGFILVSADGGILWVKASEAAKPHIKEIPVGALIDIVIEFQGKPKPPILKSWKLTSGESTCKIFDGTKCRNK